jgi:ribonuclease G
VSLLRFLRKKRQEPAATEAATPQQPEVPTEPPAQAGADTTATKKRRRGSRGGRGRARKPGEAKAETKDEATASGPERKPQRSTRAQTRRRTPTKRPPLPAAKRELIVSVDVGEQRVAVLEDDKVAEVYLERPERRSIAGNIYLGTVDNVLPGMEAAFIEIGLEKNGFLYVDEIVVPELEGKRHGRKIQDLLSRGQELLVQAVKDPMKTKGARLTTEISLPGRFVVFVPNGEGLGVSRRLPDDERIRLRDILKALEPKEGGVIVRTAAEGASAEDIERDLVFLQRLWKTIQARAKKAKAPELVYQEAELPLRVVRDLFTGDFERAVVDHDRTFKRVVGYLKKTSPHMVERVLRHKEKAPLMEAYGVEAEIRSTLSRRVDLPSGGYLIFDYAEAFTVIDVNTGRFVGSRGKSSGGRLEDTITKNNLEAVKEVVRQLRLRDIGGIIVIDFIDMANPKNRAAVEEALRQELERDRTKTYVVEISPLGLVEMTRQNVTDGPREILTKKCPTCAGDGIVVSETTAAVEAERRLRALAAGSKSKAFQVELPARVATALIGPGAARLVELETQTKRRFQLEPKDDVSHDHFVVVAEGSVAELTPDGAAREGAELDVKLVEVGLHDPHSAVAKLDGYAVAVADAAQLVGKKVKVRIERVLDGWAYATLVNAPKVADPPITAESEAEKPTRKPPAKAAVAGPVEDEVAPAEEGEPEPEREPEAPPAKPRPKRRSRAKAKPAETAAEVGEAAQEAPEEAEEAEAVVEPEPAAEDKPKRKTRRGSRGGRGRKRKTAPVAGSNGEVEAEELPVATIHVPDPELGEPREEPDAPVEAGDGNGEAKPKRRTRRGSRGGRNRRRKTATAPGESAPEAAPE